MRRMPYDQRLARILVRPLAGLPLSPNVVTIGTLLLALVAAALFATGNGSDTNWAAGFFVLARFLDHFDGEVARLTGTTSRLGYYLDYLAGGFGYAALFAGIGWGLAESGLGPWALVLGGAGVASALLSLFLKLDLDRQSALAEGEAIGYPALAGFELEDGIYPLAPVT